MTERVGGSMSGVIHDKGSVGHLTTYQTVHLGICIALDGAHALIGIPMHLMYLGSGIGLAYLFGHLVGTIHMSVFISVITQHIHQILPRTGIGSAHERDTLVHHDLCFGLGGDGESAYAQICLLTERLGTFSVIEQSEVILHHITGYVTAAILTLIAEQIVVGRIGFPGRGYHTIIPGAISHEKQVTWSIGIGLRTVIEHLHEAPIGRGIGCPAGELVIYLVGTEDSHAQPVILGMSIGQPLCLCLQFAVGRDDDDHVQAVGGMQVLILYLTHICRFGEGVCDVKGYISG